MAKKTNKKKVVVSTRKPPSTGKSNLSPTSSRSKNIVRKNEEPLLFGKQNYILLLAGALSMAIGFILMLGGEMPDANTWDEDIIYGTRRIVVAPFMILTGLVIMVFAVFKKESVIVDSPAEPKERVINKNM